MTSSAVSSARATRSSLRRLIEPVGEDAEELPEHLDRELVLFAQDLEEVAAPDDDELADRLRRARWRCAARCG